MRALPLPPRLARMVVDAARDGAARCAAQMAVLVTERGLGGNDVDLSHRLDQFRRDRSAPRRRSARHGEALGGGGRRPQARKRYKRRLAFRARLSGSRREKSRRRAGRLPAREWPRRRARSGLVACARAVHRRGRIDRHRRAGAHPAGGGDFASTRSSGYSPTRSRAREEVTVDPATLGLRGRKARRLGAIALVGTDRAVEASPENAAKLAQSDRRRWARSSALEQASRRNGATA